MCGSPYRLPVDATCFTRNQPLFYYITPAPTTEWNQIDYDGALACLAQQQAARGLLSEVPEVRPTGPGDSRFRSREQTLQFSKETAVHVKLPWLRSQLQEPAQAAVLKRAVQAAGEGRAPAPATPAPSTAAAPSTSGRTGPLLIFPDTSALLGMLNGDQPSTHTQSTPFSFDLLESLAAAGRFGPAALPAQEQVTLVVADAVFKQLDGLKGNGVATGLVRR